MVLFNPYPSSPGAPTTNLIPSFVMPTASPNSSPLIAVKSISFPLLYPLPIFTKGDGVLKSPSLNLNKVTAPELV